MTETRTCTNEISAYAAKIMFFYMVDSVDDDEESGE